MRTDVKAAFVSQLRSFVEEEIAQVAGVEYVLTPTHEAFDAYGVLAYLFLQNTGSPVGFVPTTEPFEFFFLDRRGLLAWSEITPAELNNLIELNDVEGLNFSEIANVIEGEWS